MNSLRRFLTAALLALALALPASAQLIVTTGDDTGPGSLRKTLEDAAAAAGPNTVTFASGLGTITLASEIVITDAGGVTIDASDRPAGIHIDGGPGTNRHFRIDTGTIAVFQRLKLTGGGGVGGGSPVNYGGSILNGGALTLRECTFSDNTSSNVGGAVYNQTGSLTVERCTFHGNTSGGSGAILHESLTPMTITASTFTGNIGRFEGGAITLGGFRAATITHCTITGNAVTRTGGNGSGGIRAGNPSNPASNLLTLRYSIVTENTDANIPGVPNVNPGPSSSDNLIGGDARLAPLADYGGPTPTMALRPDSPALNTATTSTVTSDQRGFPIVGVRDIGAYEAGNALTTNYNAFIWESLPNTVTVEEAARTFDFDGDGQTNEGEWLAGTGPADAGSVLRITTLTPGGANLLISFTSVTGKTYTLWQSDTLSGSWQNTGLSALSGDGSVKEFTITAPASNVPKRFYRVQVSQM